MKLAPSEATLLREEPVPYAVFGPELIDPAAIAQMDNAMRLPGAVAGVT